MKIFRNRYALHPDYIPSRIPHREDKFSEIIKYFEPVLKGESNFEHLFIIGNTGTGKTLVLKHFEKYVKARKDATHTDILYVNARFERIPGNIVRKLLKWSNPIAPARGYSVEDMYEYFLKYLNSTRWKVILVLDDSDHLFEKHSSFIYQLGRVYETGFKNKLSLIFVLRTKLSINKADLWALGGIKKNILFFEDYTYDELVDILDYRCGEAFVYGAVLKETIETAADIASKYNFNARYAIELLLKAGMIAEREGVDIVTPEHVRLARREVPPSFTYDDIKALTTQEKIVLYSLAELLSQGDKSFATTGELEKKYEETCRFFGLEPVKHTWFWKIINTLSTFGIISKRTVSKNIRGRTTITELIGLPSFSARILMEKIEDLLRNEGVYNLEE